MTYYARDTGHGLEIIDGDWLHLYLAGKGRRTAATRAD